ncbi:MAG TPA: hypothetical protein VKS22_16200 [Candidatus Binataceae bacterium]|nr:hypothetical protein [Candidatus Binataceae bacterium]
MIELGSKVRDKITGAEGTAISRLIHITGCDRYCVQPPVDKEGKFVSELWFDENRLETLEKPKPALATVGGPFPG